MYKRSALNIETGKQFLFSFIFQMRKLQEKTTLCIKMFSLYSFPVGIKPKSQKIFLFCTVWPKSSGKRSASAMFRYFELYSHSKNRWRKLSEFIGRGSRLKTHRVHSAECPATKLATLEFSPRMLLKTCIKILSVHYKRTYSSKMPSMTVTGVLLIFQSQ